MSAWLSQPPLSWLSVGGHRSHAGIRRCPGDRTGQIDRATTGDRTRCRKCHGLANCPGRISGVTVIDCTFATVTVTVVEPLTVPDSAVIVALPGATPITNPAVADGGSRFVVACPDHARGNGVRGAVVVSSGDAHLLRVASGNRGCGGSDGNAGKYGVDKESLTADRSSQQQEGAPGRQYLKFPFRTHH